MNSKENISCCFCGQYFANNLGGQLTTHLSEAHQLSLKDYVVVSEYHGIAPKCACDLCDEMPNFSRGKFKRYATGHANFDEKKRRHIEKHGQPTCKQCKEIVTSFHRGIPKIYCSSVCLGKQNGFSKPSTQQKIAKAIKEKYGVENVSYLPEVKEKISKANTGRNNPPASQETRRKMSEATKKKWQIDEFRANTSVKIKQSANCEKETNRRSKQMLEQRKNPLFLEKMFFASKNRLSKLHQKVRKKLSLDSFGFVSEQKVGRYCVDELNEAKKIAIEVNGDYIHANPKKYQNYDIIALRGNSYTAKEKWESDKIKIEFLKSHGYKVFVVWESDCFDSWKKKIESLYQQE